MDTHSSRVKAPTQRSAVYVDTTLPHAARAQSPRSWRDRDPHENRGVPRFESCRARHCRARQYPRLPHPSRPGWSSRPISRTRCPGACPICPPGSSRLCAVVPSPGLAGGEGHGSLRRLTLLMSACTTTVLRLIGRPSAREAAATRWATLSNWASVKGSVPCARALDRLVHPLVHVHARRDRGGDRGELRVGVRDVALAPGRVLGGVDRPDDRAVAVDVRRGGGTERPSAVGVVALLHRRRLGIGGLAQASEDRRLAAAPRAPCR